MADADGEPVREQPRQTSHTVMAEDESKVSSSTAVQGNCERGEEDIGTQSLPQTYRASPSLVPHTTHTGADSLPQNMYTGAENLPHTVHIGADNLPHTSHTGAESLLHIYTGADNLLHTVHRGADTLPHTAHTRADSLPHTAHTGADLPHTAHTVTNSLPNTTITTVYASVAQPSYSGTEVPHTFVVSGHQSYISPAVSSSTSRPSAKHMAYASGSVPLTSASSALITQADYSVAAEPIDFRRSSVAHASKLDRLSVPQGSKSNSGAVSLGTRGVPLCGDVTRVSASYMNTHRRLTLPQTADIGRMSMRHDDLNKTTVCTKDRVAGSQLGELLKISTTVARNASVNVGAAGNSESVGHVSTGYVLESGEVLRKTTDISGVNRRSLPPQVRRGSAQESVHSSRLGVSSISDMTALDSDSNSLVAFESGEKVWISIPVSAHSAPFTDTSKADSAEGSRMTVSLAADIHTMNTLNTCEAGIVAPGMSNIRTIVMSQMDDFSRISLPNTGGVISTTQNDDGSDNQAVSQAIGLHGADIKYSDIISRGSLPEGNRIGILQTHGGCICDDRLNLPHLQENSEVSAHQEVDTKPIILPQTGDISIVAYPPVGEGMGSMALSQTGSISMVILPQTGDLGQIALAQNDVRRVNMLPAVDSSSTEIPTADGSRMNIQQNGNVIRISIPAHADLSRLHSLPQSEGTLLQLHDDMSRTILPQTADVESKLDINRLIRPQSRDIGTEGIQQIHDVSRGIPSQSMSSIRVSKASEASAVELHQVYNIRTSHTVKSQHVSDSAKAGTSQASDGRSAHMYQGGSSIVSQAGDITDRQRLYEVGRASTPQAGDADMKDIQQVYSVVRSGLAEAAAGCTQKQVYSMERAALSQTEDMDRQQTYVTITSLSQADQVRTDASGSHGVSVAPTHEGSLIKMHTAGDMKTMYSAAYMDTSVMMLPQTSGVRVVNIACAEDAARSTLRQPLSMGTSDQPHPEYNNMRVMAEAAEIISSRGNVPEDDINMRLMAETADLVSRNVHQAAVINSAGSVQQAQDSSERITKSEARTADSRKISVPQTPVTSEMLAGNNSTGNVTVLQNMVRPVCENKTAVTPRSLAAEVSSATAARAFQGKSAPAASATQKTAGQKWKQRAATRSDKGKPIEQQPESGFRAEFLHSLSYKRWKDIGSSQGLKNDEEIACFLMKYYDNTSGVFLSGCSTCSTCQQQLSVLCVHCPQKSPAEDSSKIARTGKDRKARRGGDDKCKPWKLIVQADSKSKVHERGKEDRTEKRYRRKPRLTRRVLRRRVIASPPASSDEDIQEKEDEPALLTKVHFEERQKNTPSSMVTRKRGRPSNNSYKQASTLECSNCQRKFHTAMGLEQHIKHNRCKGTKPGTSVSRHKEPEMVDSTPATSFKFKCSDCGKEYRSKQGLMLHRASKHGELNENLVMALPEGDAGDDTDEYTPDHKDSTPKEFECSLCHKLYQTKQGLQLHKASKHSEVPEKKIKQEEGQGSVVDSMDDSKDKEGESLSCKECDKTYSSRPGYMLHMKTKHAPMVLRDCPDCEGKFKTKVELRIHIRRDHHKGKLILFCPYCPMIFHNRDILKTHMDDLHKTCRRVLFDCIACDLQFSSRIERKRHIQSEHKGRDTSLTCHFCGSWFATRHEYDEHEKAGHPEQQQEWLCAICGDSLPTRYLLQRHALTHKEKIQCTLCHKYITEPCYEDHMKRHYGNKTWKCELCGKSFIRKAELQQHTLVHRDERPFCCELCGMRYREKSRLNSHMRTHTGLKPYKCQQCEKSFTRSRELKNHMRVHTGEKPFSCTVCSRRFASSGNLSAHRRKVHKLEPIPHGQQSRKHTLEESIKPENVLPAPPPLVIPSPQLSPGAVAVGVALEIHGAHSANASEMPVSVNVPAAHSSAHVEAPLAHSVNPMEAPVAHSTTLMAHSSGAVGEAPVAHSSALTLQAPLAHQAPAAHHDQQALSFQQHLSLKYEPVVTQPDHFVPQPAQQQSQPQGQPSHAIYWSATSYGQES